MSLEDRIRSSVDTTLAELSERLDVGLRQIAREIAEAAAVEQAAAMADVRRAAVREAQADTTRQVEEAEARVRGSMIEVIAQARSAERAETTIEVRRLVEAETAQRVNEALAAAESRMKSALAELETESARRLTESVSLARVREREAEMAAVTRLLESVRSLDNARSLGEVLDALCQAAGREASRAAVLVLRHDRVLGWKLSGFGARDAQPKGIDLGLNESGVIGLAVGTARPVTTRDSQTAAEGPRFVHLPADRMGFAVPVIVAGRVVAVVYADSVAPDGQEQEVPSGWPEVVELLARHAARCLEALTVQKAVATPSPRFWVPAQSQGEPASKPTSSPPSAAPPGERGVLPPGARA
jgi:hypothetical protein